MSKSVILFLGAAALVASCSKTPKDVNVVKVIQVEGQVTILKGEGGAASKAYLGSDLLPDYSIKTGPESRVKVQIGERAVVSVEPNSVVRMRDIKKDSSSGQETTRIEFKSGKSMVNITKKLSSQDSFDVMTPSAVAGVRGTEFLVDSEDPAASRIAVTKGSVAVRKRIAALDDQPASSMPVVVREALRELAANQEMPVRVNEEVAVDRKASEEISAIVETVVKKATEEMKVAAADTSKSEEAKRQVMERSLGSIVTESQTRIEAAPAARPVVVAAMSEETKKKVEKIEVLAPVPVETLKALPEKKDPAAKDIREVMKAEASKAPETKPETRATPEGKTEAPAVTSRPAAANRTEAKTEPKVEKKETPKPEPVRETPMGTLSLNLQTPGAFVSITSADGREEIRLQPGENRVKAGRYTLRSDMKGHKAFEDSVVVEEGKTATKTVNLVKKLVATEKIVLLDGSTVTGKVLSRGETEVVIETEQGVRKLDPRKIDEIIYLKK